MHIYIYIYDNIMLDPLLYYTNPYQLQYIHDAKFNCITLMDKYKSYYIVL